MKIKALKCWCLGGVQLAKIAWPQHTLHAYMTAATHIRANTALLQLCVLKQSSRIGSVNSRLSSTMSTWTIQVGAKLMFIHTDSWARSRLLSFDVFVLKISLGWPWVQVDLSKWKEVRCGQPNIHWILNHLQRLSGWANHSYNLRTKA